MSVFLWLAALVIVFLAVLYLNPRVRKTVLIGATYISLTGWYYYRKWEKKHYGTAGDKAAKKRHSSSARRRSKDSTDADDVRYFEDKMAAEEPPASSSYAASEYSQRLSESSVSSFSTTSDEPMSKPSKSGFLRGLRRSAHHNKEDKQHTTVTETRLVADKLTVVDPPTRRTFSGRKKPASWAN